MNYRKLLKFALTLFIITTGLVCIAAQDCDPSQIIITETKARDTDPDIDNRNQNHLSFYNPSCESNGTLLIHLVGSFDNPNSTMLFPSLAANMGYHVVSIEYPNQRSAKGICGDSNDRECFYNFRKEIIDGIDLNPDINVNESNSIINRIKKLLIYMDENFENQNWSSFLQGDSINWKKTIVSGHSQGGGHAALIAKEHDVKRIIMFAAPNDYSDVLNTQAEWTLRASQTPDSAYFGFNNLNDRVVNFWKQKEGWDNIGMSSFGDTINVDINESPYSDSHQLYTNFDITGAGANHSSMILDRRLPLDQNGNPIFEEVWEYLLTTADLISSVDQLNKKPAVTLNLFPNPTGNLLYISLNNSSSIIKSVSFYSMSGQLLQSSTAFNSSIGVSHLPTGIIITNVIFKNGNSQSSLIIKQ